MLHTGMLPSGVLPFLQTRNGLLAASGFSFVLLLLLFRASHGLIPSAVPDLPVKLEAAANLFNHVHNKTLGFERVFTINMPARTDHRDGVTLAAAMTGFKVEMIPGVDGNTVDRKALPDTTEDFNAGLLGSWRAHMNVMRKVIEDDLSSALVFEDDLDWDIDLKNRLYDFAISAHAIQAAESRGRRVSRIPFEKIDPLSYPSTSPYGDDWDVLWLGHCGMNIDTDRLHVVHVNDPSVPELQHLASWEAERPSPLTPFGHHVRLVGRNDGTCTLAYAVSQSGARKILYAMAVKKLSSAFDVMLAAFCKDAHTSCLGSLPQLFDHHRVKGPRDKDSLISGAGGVREKSFTKNIRYSVRLNLEKMLHGATDFEDQWPDTVKS